MAREQSWDQIAQDLGLQVRWGKASERPPMRGHVGGRGVRVAYKPTSLITPDEGGQTELLVRARRALPIGLRIEPRGRSQFGDAPAAHLIVPEDPVLANSIQVWADSDVGVEGMLSLPAVTGALVEAYGRFPELVVTEQGATLDEQVSVRDADVLRGWIEQLSELLERLEAGARGELRDAETHARSPIAVGETRGASRGNVVPASSEVIRTYRRRQGIFVGWILLTMGTCAAVWYRFGGNLESLETWLGLPSYGWAIIAFLMFAAIFAVWPWAARCPACGKSLQKAGIGELFPRRCPRCGERLS